MLISGNLRGEIDMNGNAELLNFVVQNSQMGIETLPRLLEMVKNEKFSEHLKKQLAGYEKFKKQAGELLREQGCEEKELSGMEKVKTYLMLNLQTMMDKSDSHIAQMLIQGSTMGVTDAVKKLHDYADADRKVVGLMEDLRKFEEESIEKLKVFL